MLRILSDEAAVKYVFADPNASAALIADRNRSGRAQSYSVREENEKRRKKKEQKKTLTLPRVLVNSTKSLASEHTPARARGAIESRLGAKFGTTSPNL